jgi:CheY-like chemotaxis protein
MCDYTILIVEDNPANLELVTDLLEAGGFSVRQARDASEGLQLARETLPDLILMDLSLPGRDGLSATRELKSDPVTQHIPVVALTAHAMLGDECVAREAGCNGYLTKPIDTRRFAQSLGVWLKPGPGVIVRDSPQTSTENQNEL